MPPPLQQRVMQRLARRIWPLQVMRDDDPPSRRQFCHRLAHHKRLDKEWLLAIILQATSRRSADLVLHMGFQHPQSQGAYRLMLPLPP